MALKEGESPRTFFNGHIPAHRELFGEFYKAHSTLAEGPLDSKFGHGLSISIAFAKETGESLD